MSESRMTAVRMEQEPTRTIAMGVGQTLGVAQGFSASVGLVQAALSSGLSAGKLAFTHVGVWAGDTAQQFGTLVAVLMGPAVFSAYAFAAWALAANLGWTGSFIFTSGALSSWIVWMGMAVLVNTAASILKKHTQAD